MGRNKRKEDNSDILSSLPFDTTNLSEENQLLLSVLLFAVNSNKNELLKKIEEKDQVISSLNTRVKELEDKLSAVEEKLDYAEVDNRKCEIIISGPNLPECKTSENVTNVVQAVLRDKLQYSLPLEKIKKCHRIGKKPVAPNCDRRNFLVKLADEETKSDILSGNKSIRPSGLYINENLTSNRRSILYVLRRAKKDFPNIVKGCTSINGDIFAWVKSTSTRDRRIMVNNFRSLDKFCNEIINSSIASYLPDFTF